MTEEMAEGRRTKAKLRFRQHGNRMQQMSTRTLEGQGTELHRGRSGFEHRLVEARLSGRRCRPRTRLDGMDELHAFLDSNVSRMSAAHGTLGIAIEVHVRTTQCQ